MSRSRGEKVVKCQSCKDDGWILAEIKVHTINRGTHELRIERCDACEKFKDDNEAVKWVARMALEGQEVRKVMLLAGREDSETPSSGQKFKDGGKKSQEEA